MAYFIAPAKLFFQMCKIDLIVDKVIHHFHFDCGNDVVIPVLNLHGKQYEDKRTNLLEFKRQ